MKHKNTLILSSLLLFTFTAILSLSSCTGKEDQQKTVLTVQAEQGWLSYYEAAAKRVEKANPGTEIKIIEIGAFDHLDKLDSLNSDVADLFAIPADRLYSLAENEVLAPINSQKIASDLGGWQNFDSGLGGNLKIGDKYLAFPLNIETLVTFVNTENAKRQNIDYTTPFELSIQNDPATILVPLFEAWFGVALTNASGIQLLAKNGNDFFSDLTKEFNELSDEKKAAIEAIYKYWLLNYEKTTSLFDPDAGWGYIDKEFTIGNNGVIRLGGPWDTASISEQTKGNLVIYPINHITINGLPILHWKGGWGLAINSRVEKDKNKYALAEAMIKEIINPKYAIDFFKATGKILENVPASLYASSNLSDIEKTVIESVIESYKISPQRPIFKEWGKVWETWRNAVLSWNSINPENPEQAYKALKDSFDAMMTNF